MGKKIEDNATEEIMPVNVLFYTAPAEKPTRLSSDIRVLDYRLAMTKLMYQVNLGLVEEGYSNVGEYTEVDLIIVDEIDRLKLQHLEQLRDIYDQNDLTMIFIGMPSIDKRLSRYPQLYSRIDFAHEFDNLSKDETHLL